MNKLSDSPSSQIQHRHNPRTTASTRLLTHYRVFHDGEWEIVERSLTLLQASGFYWGPLSVHEAHARLLQEPVGTYLLRDSSQGNCLFSLSVRMPSGPVSLRISFQKGYFWLKDWFSDCVVRLLELVVAGTRAKPLHCDEMGDVPLVFSEPLCRERRIVPKLQELCQQVLFASSGPGDSSSWSLPPSCQKGNTSLCMAVKNMDMSIESVH
uniref:suppressor of cytokine signaling 1-like n=1 Tax=Euleptes europaea TaxID=460621 RepID=UPI00253FEF72|nr:suppressor of cytokine signaling 1-like [Euleptes europaea]